MKTAGLIDALAAALRRRGVEANLAALAAQTGMAAFNYAVSAWAEDPTSGLEDNLTRAFDQLRGLSSRGGAAGSKAR
jgi:hypothetical protein